MSSPQKINSGQNPSGQNPSGQNPTQPVYVYSQPQKDGVEKIYDGAASFGKVMAVFGAIIMTVITIVIFVAGIKVLTNKNPKQSVNGTVISATCDSLGVDRNDNPVYECSMHITYSVNGQAYTIVIDDERESRRYSVGDTVVVYYDPNNPSNGTINAPFTKNQAKVAMIIVSVLCLLTWLWTYAVFKVKFLAAMQGVNTGMGLFGR